LEKCVGCQFYDRHDAEVEDKGVRWGKCRRTGPIVHPVSAKTYMVEGIWPHVRDDDWCGEWVAMKRKLDASSADPMNLLMQSAAAPIRNSTVPIGSLMTPAASGETTHVPTGGHFASD
jgi:hypothetical protein